MRTQIKAEAKPNKMARLPMRPVVIYNDDVAIVSLRAELKLLHDQTDPIQ